MSSSAHHDVNARAAQFPPSIPHKLEKLRGPGSSNVLIRGCLLQGPHPGSSTAEIVSNLRPLLEAGVTTFVCLQQEVPSAATAASAGSRATTYGGNIVASARAYSGDAQALVDNGGFPTSGRKLSFVHFPMPASPEYCPPESLVKQIVSNNERPLVRTARVSRDSRCAPSPLPHHPYDALLAGC